MKFLTANNIKYFLIAIDIVTHRQFWAYEKTDRFNELLHAWVGNNPKHKK